MLAASADGHLYYWDNALRERSAPSSNGTVDVGSGHVIVSRPVLQDSRAALFTSGGGLFLVQLPSSSVVWGELYLCSWDLFGEMVISLKFGLFIIVYTKVCLSLKFPSLLNKTLKDAAHFFYFLCYSFMLSSLSSQSSLSARALHVPQGILSGFGRRVSSLFFGGSSGGGGEQGLEGRSMAVRDSLTGCRSASLPLVVEYFITR